MCVIPMLSLFVENFYGKFGAYKRKNEKFYSVTHYIAEFWNTLTNLPFIIFGLYSLFNYELDWTLTIAYSLLVGCGVGSAIHHGSHEDWTTVIDWVPILCSIGFVLWSGIIYSMSFLTFSRTISAFIVLLLDHIYTPLPVPWGHCAWHILAAIAVNSLYSDYYYSL